MAMREFSRYVPRSLVERLIRSGEESIRTVERELTILFSDIIEFTTLSERMNASDTATVLNDIFDIQCREIEAQNGTVDKFMGDGLMAFWGAPDADPDHASHAIASAAKIASAAQAFNRERREKGLPPLRLRMGIHTGRVVVGNIGGGSRQNYTIIGDAVNVTQRIEQMGKELMAPDDDTIVLVSDHAVKTTTGQFSFKPVGTRVIRGRERPVAVFILDTGSTAESATVVAFPGTGRAS
jgi:class 3 adenylate cyclase